MADTSLTVPVETLQSFISDALIAKDVSQDDAATVAGLMAQADMLGYGTHGVFRLRQYLARLTDGGCNPSPSIRTIQETLATALIDGDNGLGHLAMNAACNLAIEKAQKSGISWVGVRRGNHAGPLALYVRPQAQHNMIGMAAAIGSANHVPAYGATELLLGTNPIAMSAPSADKDPFVLDMATTVAAMGKIKTLAQRDEAMPEGWMVGRDGKPLTDPKRRTEGFMLPIGGAKGFGLSVAIGLMAGGLNGAAFGSDVVDFTSDTTSETNTGQFVLAVDIKAFGSVDEFKANSKRVFDELRASSPLPGYEAVRLPGEGKGELLRARRESGIPLNKALVDDLRALAIEHGLDSL